MAKPGSKYQPLHEHLRSCKQDEVTLTFSQIEKLLGAALPASARHRGWWANRKTGSLHAAAWIEAGFQVSNIDLDHKRIIFSKPQPMPRNYAVKRIGDTVLWDADLIRALRAHLSMSQAEFAEQLGVRQQTVSEWETGAYAPTRATSKHLALVAERAGFTYGDGA
jgi:DNA-binding transcriptional regulator YiaG